MTNRVPLLALIALAACATREPLSPARTSQPPAPPGPPPMIQATRLAIVEQPSSVGAGIAFTIKVGLADSSGNVLPGASGRVYLAVSEGIGLSGAQEAESRDGVATFSLTDTRAQQGLVFTASESGLSPVRTAPISVASGPPRRLVFVTQPPDSAMGHAVLPAIRVAVLDSFGNLVVTPTVSISIGILHNEDQAPVLAGTVTRPSISGIATFDNLRISEADTVVLAADANGLTSTDPSHPVFMTSGPPSRLAVSMDTQGGAATWGVSPVIINVLDSSGNIVRASSAPITISLASNPTGAAISGLTTVNATRGVVEFSHIAISKAGSGYAFAFRSAGVSGATGGSFTVVEPAITGDAIVSVGGETSCAITTSGTRCWGSNASGQFGNGQSGTYSTTPTPAGNGMSFTQISVGNGNACGIAPDGSAWCWGSGALGQLGNGGTSSSTTPVPVSGGYRFTAIAAGGRHTCGITTSGVALCWGANDAGELGNGTLSASLVPAAVSGGVQFRSISVSGPPAFVQTANVHTCAIATDGAAWCWGANNVGQLGDGPRTNATTPVAVRGTPHFRAISAGHEETCALTGEGQPWCWHFGTTAPLLTSTTGLGGPVFADIRASAEAICALTPAGDAYCWQGNTYGQSGTGTSPLSYASFDEPMSVHGSSRFIALSNSAWHICGVTVDGSIMCWGANSAGQIGNGTTVEQDAPVTVSGGLAAAPLTSVHP